MTNKLSPPPKGLSRRSADLWRRLLADNDLTPDSTEMLERALRSFDVADELLVLARAAGLGSPKARSLLASARDASQTALKLMRATGLDKADPDARRRPGRPSGSNWSAIRRQRLLGGTA